jgi:hypothetical protein
MEHLVVPARVRDAEALLKLQYLCYQTEAALYSDYTIAPLVQSLAELLAHSGDPTGRGSRRFSTRPTH